MRFRSLRSRHAVTTLYTAVATVFVQFDPVAPPGSPPAGHLIVAERFTVSARHRLGDRDRDEQQKEAQPNTATKGRSFDDSFCAAWLGTSSW